ncbi:DUF1493 family protein [Sphingobacterium siyangense]|uniref:Uncharacterized protein DUF1493 n=1 Tax=Sphingobacterium siyangense TaxID=459529 RepID=A0A562MMU2_9SPHI|nr:DUF1493 family protein [Sphingobacterium siyangense]TWI21190.1 uncharacterized protein DUF1493 [Sphingobacterium siyangense]
MNNKWIKFLERHLGKHEIDGLSDDMEIEDDLGISGEDGYEFFEDFCQTFNIDTKGNSAAEFFHPESFLNFFKFWQKDVGEKKKLTIGMLKKIIEQGSF